MNHPSKKLRRINPAVLVFSPVYWALFFKRGLQPSTLTFTQLLWLVPLFFAIHNVEETPFMAKWTEKLDSPIHPKVTTRQFAIAVTLLTLGSIVITYFGTRNPDSFLGPIFVLAIQAILFVNAFVPHIVMTVKMKMYSPGLVTAVLINIPFTIYLFNRALQEQKITPILSGILLLVAPFAMIGLAWGALWLGEKTEALL
jgi:hypothetical protein